MKTLILFFALIFLGSPQGWLTDLKQAEMVARKENKLILLNFSGSDWCGPCIKLEKEIFDNEAFKTYSAGKLVLVNADFPRLKKNQLSASQVALNETMAETYNKTGLFPLTLLLDANGHVLRKWEGRPAKDAESFIALLNAPVK